jgi:hypothetical protein
MLWQETFCTYSGGRCSKVVSVADDSHPSNLECLNRDFCFPVPENSVAYRKTLLLSYVQPIGEAQSAPVCTDLKV